MEFKYTEFNGIFRPTVPLTVEHNNRSVLLDYALLDTGADICVFPMEIATTLKVELDTSRGISMGNAGGGKFMVIPSVQPLSMSIESKGYRSYTWQGKVWFAPRQPNILLGHKHCLEKFDVLFKGPEKTLKVTPRF